MPSPEIGGVLNPVQDQLFSGAILSNNPVSNSENLAGVGYATGAGGTVTQLTNKSTSVILNKVCGTITMNNAGLATVTAVSFTVNNTNIAATDVPQVAIKSGGTANSYLVAVTAVATGTCVIMIYNLTGGTLSEALVLNFFLNKAVSS